jgi:hypothetical protein
VVTGEGREGLEEGEGMGEVGRRLKRENWDEKRSGYSHIFYIRVQSSKPLYTKVPVRKVS